MQPGGDFAATCVRQPNSDWPAAVASCFRIPPDEWVTFLLHVIPGKHVQSWAGWPTSADPVKGTGMQLWGATQTRIDTMRNAGQTPTYQLIYNKVGANAYPFFYSNGNADTQAPNYSDVPPAWNCVNVWVYQNNLPQAIAWRRWYAQVIFKKGDGTQNQSATLPDPNVDGIPCPVY
jgi:hypothetical protein